MWSPEPNYIPADPDRLHPTVIVDQLIIRSRGMSMTVFIGKYSSLERASRFHQQNVFGTSKAFADVQGVDCLAVIA